MKALLAVLLLSFSIINVKAQKDADTTIYNYQQVDGKAEFPRGLIRLNEYLNLRMKPDQSYNGNINEGVITVECVIEKNGKISQVEVLKSLDPVFDENFKNLFWSMPKWKPAFKNGQPVRSKYQYSMEINYVPH